MFQEGPLQRNVFDPLAQHRDWCPWVNTGKENKPEDITLLDGDAEENQPGWKAALNLLLPMKKTSDVTGRSPSQVSTKRRDHRQLQVCFSVVELLSIFVCQIRMSVF